MLHLNECWYYTIASFLFSDIPLRTAVVELSAERTDQSCGWAVVSADNFIKKHSEDPRQLQGRLHSRRRDAVVVVSFVRSREHVITPQLVQMRYAAPSTVASSECVNAGTNGAKLRHPSSTTPAIVLTCFQCLPVSTMVSNSLFPIKLLLKKLTKIRKLRAPNTSRDASAGQQRTSIAAPHCKSSRSSLANGGLSGPSSTRPGPPSE